MIYDSVLFDVAQKAFDAKWELIIFEKRAPHVAFMTSRQLAEKEKLEICAKLSYESYCDCCALVGATDYYITPIVKSLRRHFQRHGGYHWWKYDFVSPVKRNQKNALARLNWTHNVQGRKGRKNENQVAGRRLA